MRLGILISNIGTPDAPTTKAVRRYLNEFLSDRRVISLSPLLWQPILKSLILPFRSRRSAKLYQKIWSGTGSPLLKIAEKQCAAIQTHLKKNYANDEFRTALGMRYGNPSIPQAMTDLQSFHPEKIIVLPLFPQYSASTTASIADAVNLVLRKWRNLPQITFINHYYDNKNYINALANSIKTHWQQQGKKQHLLFSFHGIPKEYIDAGDVYASHCHKTATLVVDKLGVEPGQWSLAFQSRFGPKEWLKPYCVDVLTDLPRNKINGVDIICPGFSADCLETLEEIAQTNKKLFFTAGGKEFNYIPALNDHADHINCLASVIMAHPR